MRAGARLWADSTDSETTGEKKSTGKGCNVTRRGTKQLSAFCHMKPPRNICDRNCRPRRHGGLCLCLRQIFISPIGRLCKREISLPPSLFQHMLSIACCTLCIESGEAVSDTLTYSIRCNMTKIFLFSACKRSFQPRYWHWLHQSFTWHMVSIWSTVHVLGMCCMLL